MNSGRIARTSIIASIALFATASPSLAEDRFGYHFENPGFARGFECLRERDYMKLECSDLFYQTIENMSETAENLAEKGIYEMMYMMQPQYLRSFSRAEKKDPGVRRKIASMAMAVAREGLFRNNTSIVRSAVEVATQYDSAHREEAGELLFQQGVQEDNLDLQDMLFEKAPLYNPSVSLKISRLYIEQADSLPDDEKSRKISLLDMAGSASDTYTDEIGDRIAELIPDLKGAERQYGLKILARYWGEDLVEEVFPPEFKIYPPGEYSFNMKEREILDHWIMLPEGKYRIALSSS